MSPIKIHPDFRLQGQSFKDQTALLNFVKTHYYDSFEFLQQLFDDSETIIVQTSGSTGIPKKIKVLKTAMIASAVATGQFFILPEKTTALHCLSSGFIAGKMMWVRALHLGWHLSLVPPNKKPLLDKDESFDFCAMVPLQVQNSLGDIHRIKKLIIGGAAISYDLEYKLKNLPTACFQTYGMTETITHIAVRKLSNAREYYKSLPTIKFAVDHRNCLQIEAPLLLDEIIKTNDIVNLISSTEFEWLGRFDNVINSGGIKLFPEQIESKLASVISKPFIVGAVPDKKLGEKLVLLIESIKPISNIENKLLSSGLSKYEIPKKIYYLPSFIRTKNAKVNRKQTLKLLL